LRLFGETVTDPAQSHDLGAALGRRLAGADLAGVLVLSDGLQVNGSQLIHGLVSILGPDIPLSGGLAGDGARFASTLVGANAPPQSGRIAALGFYGTAIRFSHGSAGGWDAFGPPRRVTRSSGNVLFELDGKPALDLYERYLGEEAEGLPGTGLRYPLKVWDPASPAHDIVRTVLSIDRNARSLIFAGDVPEGWTAQLMRGSFDHLIAGAGEAAAQARANLNPAAIVGDSLALLISCVGRRVLMSQRAEEEIEATHDVLGADVVQLGFYSYGEIAPHLPSGFCGLHNQTMTLTLLAEVEP
jgi:hypothetical protein